MFRYQTDEFTDQELDILAGRSERCEGCFNLPTNGFRSPKRKWCLFSWKIGILQEDPYWKAVLTEILFKKPREYSE